MQTRSRWVGPWRGVASSDLTAARAHLPRRTVSSQVRTRRGPKGTRGPPGTTSTSWRTMAASGSGGCRAAPVTLAAQIDEAVAAEGQPDVVLASSMTDLAGLLGIARRHLAGAATALYMHENQLTYPLSPRDGSDATYPMTQWKAMAAADLVLFNSSFHRVAWFEAVPGFLGQFPDYRHGRALIDGVAGRSEVMPVGVDLARLVGPPLRSDPPLILWNQRVEHDKAPEAFVAAVIALAAAGPPFRVALAGERFVSEPAAFDRLRVPSVDRIVHDGYADGTGIFRPPPRRRRRCLDGSPGVLRHRRHRGGVRGGVPGVAEPARLSGADSGGTPRPLSLRRCGRSRRQTHVGAVQCRTGSLGGCRPPAFDGGGRLVGDGSSLRRPARATRGRTSGGGLTEQLPPLRPVLATPCYSIGRVPAKTTLV